MQKNKKEIKQKRKRIFKEVVQAFEEKFSWLGHQAARELLLSAASWNIEEHSNPPFRYRTHVMLAWEKGWFKSTILRKMRGIMGDAMTSKIAKVSDAALRGSSAGGEFTPPKVLKAPILVSTEFGQTDFSDELLNMLLALLEEGETNVALNKLGGVTDKQRQKVQKDYGGKVSFTDTNEFEFETNFVMWGATYDPSKLQDDALRSRFNIVTPAKPLDHQITDCADHNHFHIDSDVVKNLRDELRRDMEMETNFTPPKKLYKKYNLEPRESAPLQSYMACRNWWGLEVNPDVMEDFIQHLQRSRKLAQMNPEDRIFDLIFDNPMTYEEMEKETGYNRRNLYKILNRMNEAEKRPSSMFDDDRVRWAIFSSQKKEEETVGEQSGLETFGN
jgi:hypothetical protein